MIKYKGLLLLGTLVLLGAIAYFGNTFTTHDIQPNTALMFETVHATIFKEKTDLQKRILIDVRTPEEYEAGHIQGARNIDFSDPSFIDEMSTLDKNAAYSIYCRSGNRSGQALELMDSLGFTDILDLQGGIISWEQNSNTLCTNC